MSDLEKILAAAVDDYASSGHSLFVILKERLLPLLEAGQAMRDWVEKPWGSGGFPMQDWDAAKRKGMK